MNEALRKVPMPLGAGTPVLAFDVGGTDTKSALIDHSGRVLGLRRTPTATGENPARAVAESLGVLARELCAEFPDVRPRGAGVGVPGLVNEAAGIGVFASNLRWRDAPIRDLASEAIGLPVAFCHDVRAAGQAELMLGAARGFQSVVVLAIGTGIAGAIIVDGKPYASDGFAGEFGHSLSDPQGERCPCGAIGCLETIASAGAIARRYAAATQTTVSGAKEVFVAAEGGDPAARLVWDNGVNALGDELARIAAMLAPEAIVIGGGLSQAGPRYLSAVAERMDSRLSFHRRPQVLHATLGDDGGLFGTALAARELADATSSCESEGGCP
ncbi:MAG: ROK family protein [Rhodoglobus sp.]